MERDTTRPRIRILHVIRAARCVWKSGAGGFALIIVPSLDLVIYKMGGTNGQYDPCSQACIRRMIVS